MIVAMNKIGVIGVNNNLPWKIKDDLKLFKAYTLNNDILMGKNTFKSLGSKPLPKRHNIIISSSLKKQDLDFDNISIYSNLENILKEYQNNNKDLWIIGGRQIYLNSLPYINKAYVSLVHNKVNGDIVMPFFWEETTISGINKWNLLEETFYDKNIDNEYSFTLKVFEQSK